MTLDNTGNLILAGGNSVIQSVANSSLEPNYPNTSTMVFTPDALYSSQSLVLDPTGPSHIHLRAPGANIDEPDANIFLGGEESSFEVGYYNGNVPNLYIHSGGNTWTFDNGGTLLFPRDTDPNTADPILTIVGGANPIISSIDASLAGPANLDISALTTIFSGVSGDEIKIYPDDGEISSTSNLQIWANSGGNTEYSWTFGDDGNLTLSGNTVAINFANGTPAFGNIVSVNLDGNISNVLLGNGVFASIPSPGELTANLDANTYSIANLGAIDFDTAANISVGQGQMAWNSSDGTLDIGLGYSNVVLQVGQETHYVVRNDSGNTILNGTAVYCSGVTTGSGRVEASPMTGSTDPVKFLGLATQNITDGVNGVVTYFGYVRGLDTRGTANTAISVGDETWAVGDQLYVHPTAAGKLTNVEPEAPNVKICVASIMTRNETSGTVFVRPTTNLDMVDLSDVQIDTPANGEVLQYVSANSRWENTSISSIANGNSNVSIASSNGNVVINAVGNTTMTVTGTGANVTGTLNATGNVIGGNISTAGQITSTQAGNLSDGGGQLYLNGSGNNRIDFNTNGTGTPAFTTRSAGTKVVLYPSIGASATDYAVGVDSGTFWSGIPAADGGQFFKWYAGTTEVANLSGTGILTVTGNIAGANISTTGTLTSTGKIGYASGSTVTQTTNRGNGVTINALAGTIITTSAAMVANQIDTFSVANDQVDPNNDIVLVQIVSPNFGVYNCIAQPSATISVSLTGFYINIVNISGFTTSDETITIRFMVIKAPNA
jgi:hypothetical protein